MQVASHSVPRGAAAIFELQMKRRRMIATIALFIVFELAMIGTSPFAITGASATEGDLLRQVLLVGALGLQFIAPSNARPAMAIPVSILVLLGYCLLTCSWALDPSIALRRLALTALVIVVLVRAIGDLGAVRTFNVIRAWLVIMLAINFATVWFTPYGIHTMTVYEVENVIGDWRGIAMQKNAAGSVCAFTVLMFAFDRGRLNRVASYCIIAASLYFLMMTNSKTSIAMLAVASAAGWAMQWYKPRHRSLVVPVAIIVGVGLAGLIVIYLGVIRDILNDPGAFTGRSQIWPLLLEYAQGNLWKGAGFMSFWQIGPDSPIWTLTDNWVASTQGHGHNGYLDILVTLGLPGLILTLAVLVVWPALKLLFSIEISRDRRSLLVALMVFALGHNTMESSLLDRLATVHIFLMIAIIMIHRLSSQSAGAHHAYRQRLVRLTQRKKKPQVPRPQVRRAAPPAAQALRADTESGSA